MVEAEQEKMGKISVKCIQLSCRAVLNEYRDQANKLKQQKKLLPFYPKEGFYTQKYIGKRFLTSETKTYSVINNLAAVWFKICVHCNFNDNRVICYIKTQLKYPKSLKAILRRLLFLESPHLMDFYLKGSQMLQQNFDHIK